MHTPREIYEEYRIPPWLQLHQLRVAAVGRMIAESVEGPVDIDLITRTCLVHDIGAIVKFDFTFKTASALIELCPPEEIPQWTRVQEEMRTKYGTREYEASDAILRELGMKGVRGVFKDMGFRNIERILAEERREAQIAQYADMRVGPFGVVSSKERVTEVVIRYAAYWAREGRTDEARRYPALAASLEEHIFERSRIAPGDINDESITPLIEQLWDYQVS